MNNKDKVAIYYNIAHIICFLLIYVGSLILLFVYIKNIFIRISGFPVLFFVCGLLEEKVMVFCVNPLVWVFLPKEIREEEIKIVKKSLMKTKACKKKSEQNENSK